MSDRKPSSSDSWCPVRSSVSAAASSSGALSKSGVSGVKKLATTRTTKTRPAIAVMRSHLAPRSAWVSPVRPAPGEPPVS
jgi:hypothetical protein